MRRYIMGVSSVVSAAVLLGPVIALAAAFTNGSFESSPIDPGTFTTVNATDSTTITGWTVSAGSVDYIGTYWTGSNGSTRSIDLSGNSAGSISQAFTTTIGATYTVTFDLSGNPDNGADLKDVLVSATGGASTHYFFNTSVGNTHADMMWQSQTYTFTATTNSTTLTFTSLNNSAYGPALDNVAVSLTQNPTPITVDQCKNGGWMTLSDGQGNTFKNQGDCVSFVATKNKNLGAVAPTI